MFRHDLPGSKPSNFVLKVQKIHSHKFSNCTTPNNAHFQVSHNISSRYYPHNVCTNCENGPFQTTLTAKIIHITHHIIRTNLTMFPIFSLCDEILTQESGVIVCVRSVDPDLG